MKKPSKNLTVMNLQDIVWIKSDWYFTPRTDSSKMTETINYSILWDRFQFVLPEDQDKFLRREKLNIWSLYPYSPWLIEPAVPKAINVSFKKRFLLIPLKETVLGP